MHPNARNQDSVVDPSLYKWGTAGRTRRQMADEAARTKLTGYGWVGDSVERQFAAMAADIVSSKSAKLLDGYERFDCDSLLIYQNQTLPCLDIEGARHRAKNTMAPLFGSSGFHNVYVDDGEGILEFTAAPHPALCTNLLVPPRPETRTTVPDIDMDRSLAYIRVWSLSGTTPRAMPVSRIAVSTSRTSARIPGRGSDRRRGPALGLGRGPLPAAGRGRGSDVRGDLHDAGLDDPHHFSPQGQPQRGSGI